MKPYLPEIRGEETTLLHDVQILRTLARAYAEAANDPRNTENRKLHTAVNDLKMIRPVVLMDEIPFHELNFDGSLTLHCEDPILRGAEDWLRKKLFQWKHFPADMILPPYYPVAKIIHSTGHGFSVEEEVLVKDDRNHIISHEYHDQLEEEESVEKFHLPVVTYDEEATMKIFNRLGEVFGDLLPVRLTGVSCYAPMWDDIARLRGVTPLLIDLVERPEHTHNIMRRMTDYYLSLHEQYERLGLFEIEPLSLHCTTALNSTLPGDYDGGPVKRSQVWGRGMAQIFASVSKDMHEEFDFAYMKEVMEPFGLVYYGCCEPLDKKIDLIERLPHLRKISITPWADIDNAAAIIGNRYVIANKPNPSAVSGKLDEDALRKEIGRILAACKRNGCNFDMVLKDISSAGYDVNNLIRWEQIVMEMVRNY